MPPGQPRMPVAVADVMEPGPADRIRLVGVLELVGVIRQEGFVPALAGVGKEEPILLAGPAELVHVVWWRRRRSWRSGSRMDSATSWSQRIFTRPGWRHGRLTAIESELADLGHIDLRHIPLPERSRCLQRDRSRTSGLSSRLRQTALGRADAGEVPAWWADRLAEIAAPPLPGRDAGLGMDLGL